ncbi:MAG: FecR family protein [Elusimicrobiota bacterium]
MNRKILSLLLLILTLPAFAASEEAKIIAFSGNIEVRNTREGQWVPATENIEIAEGGAVRSGADGSAVMLMPNKTKVWIKESSTLELEQRTTLASRLALVFGKIKVRVPHLLRKEKFEVRTPSAVCAVRGTELTLDTNEAGAMVINVLYGEVKLSFVIPSEKGKSEFYIPQGRSMSLEERGKPAKLAMMTSEQEKSSLENWNPGLSPDDRRKEMKSKDHDRAQIREFAKVTNGTENSVKTFLNNVKESDLEAGRTLKDVHGNTVRVDQRLMRPDNSTLQFFNLVKRPVYNNSDTTAAAAARGGFVYNGAASVDNRLDLLQMTMKFNQELPQRIEEWPGFFNGNSVDPVYISVIMANRTNREDIFFIGEGSIYDTVRKELVSNPMVVGIPTTENSANDQSVLLTGRLTGSDAVMMLNAISRLDIKDTAGAVGSDGTMQYTTDDGATWTNFNTAGLPLNDVRWALQVPQANGKTNHYEVTGDPALWQYRADLYTIGGQPGAYIWYAKENYAINNSGAIQQVEDFTSSNLDPFTILKNVAGESLMYIKTASLGSGLPATNAAAYTSIDPGDYYAGNSNIDLVIIPDLALAAVQKMLPALTKLND